MVNLINATTAAMLACPPICQGAYPKMLIASDSTAANYDSPPLQGWGKHIGSYMNLAVINLAKNGRSTRTFINEGLWAKLLDLVAPGDFVVIEFGHNDDGDPTDPNNYRAPRNTLPGIGDESVEVVVQVNATKGGSKKGSTPRPAALVKGVVPAVAAPDSSEPAVQPPSPTETRRETVHTFGWYLKNMIVDVRDKGGIPVLSGMAPRLRFSNMNSTGVFNTTIPFATWTREVADLSKTEWVDHTYHTILELWKLGPAKSKEMYPNDFTHTNDLGARLVAETFVRALACGNTTMSRYINNKPLGLITGGCLNLKPY